MGSTWSFVLRLISYHPGSRDTLSQKPTLRLEYEKFLSFCLTYVVLPLLAPVYLRSRDMGERGNTPLLEAHYLFSTDWSLTSRNTSTITFESTWSMQHLKVNFSSVPWFCSSERAHSFFCH
ncbi:hypothetical protein CEXT_491371 [Caerostris extrusa]|uniref:Uncharacterized protein n=1 Tax=Caerostris extrusa TaxID=172846 RepID=A0AAV4SX00_CAEEX|nr:hypothetical protein CEXT_491371 [Caerostris extrusa]